MNPEQLLDQAILALQGIPSTYSYGWPANWATMTLEEKADFNQKPGRAIFINPVWVKTMTPSPTRDWFVNLIASQNGVPHIIP